MTTAGASDPAATKHLILSHDARSPEVLHSHLLENHQARFAQIGAGRSIMTTKQGFESVNRALLITGPPGVGKTTAIRRIAASLPGWRLAGFYTEEIRVAGKRKGFRALTFDGFEQIMAHLDVRGPHRVGKYGVDVSVIDQLADSQLALNPTVDLYIVDEIGKMECYSQRFESAMRRLLNSRALLVAAIARKGGGLIAEAKEKKGVELWEVTRANRDELPDRAVAWLQAGRPSNR